MLLETTHYEKKHKELIEELVGKPFSLLQSIKLKGIGSKRMIVDDVSPNMQHVLNLVSDLNYANIEMRPQGILIHITKGLRNFSWVIPYYQLVIYKTNGSSIHAQGKFIHFRNDKMLKSNKRFFEKLMDAKVEFDKQYNFQDYL